MDFFDERVRRALRDGRSKAFHQILNDVRSSHNTLRCHLNAFVTKGVITREQMLDEGRGRPTFRYSLPPGGSRLTADALTGLDEMVTLPFHELNRLCRFQRGGRCRRSKGRCEPQKCPQIQKSRALKTI
jgi:DNA-binding HxlR family transcriptional regulator